MTRDAAINFLPEAISSKDRVIRMRRRSMKPTLWRGLATVNERAIVMDRGGCDYWARAPLVHPSWTTGAMWEYGSHPDLL
jgi:hypothetical protein